MTDPSLLSLERLNAASVAKGRPGAARSAIQGECS